jgi:hypothetical protein
VNDNVGVASGLIASILLAGLAWCGLRFVAISLGLAVLLAGVLLIVLNRAWLPPWDLSSYRAPLAITSIPVAPLVVQLQLTPVTGDRLWVIRGILAALTVGSSAIYLSNILDWCYTLPRLSGARGHRRPCQESTDGRWRTLTQLLLGQRIVTYVVVRVGIATSVGFAAAAILAHASTATASIVSAGATVLAGYYLNRVIPMASLATDPPLHIGDKVILAEEFGASPAEWPSYYVVNVVFEGVHLLELDAEDRPIGGNPARGHDRILELSEIKRLLRRRVRFVGCDQRCCGANEFCPERFAAMAEPGESTR